MSARRSRLRKTAILLGRLVGDLVEREGTDKLWSAIPLLLIGTALFAAGWGGKIIWDKTAARLGAPPQAVLVIARDGQDLGTAPMRPCYIASVESSHEDVIVKLSTGKSPFPEVEASLDPRTSVRVNGRSVWPRPGPAATFPEDGARDFVRFFKSEIARSTRVRLIVRPSAHGSWALEEGTVEMHPSEDVRGIEIRREKGVP